ncbi:MAG: rRNA maturation RNase YbeY [Sphaerochaetaceae bacterium]|nr:rRNA maturation RNase YbeY [Sphaerochaetaceae bacterium]
MHVIDIGYDDPSFESRASRALVRERLESILDGLGQDNVEFSCTFVSDDRIRELNRQWRGKDESTDILSFVQSDMPDECSDVIWPMGFGETGAELDGDAQYAPDAQGDGDEVEYEDDESVVAPDMELDQPRMLGDMVISLDSLKRNADYFSVSEDEELYRLLIHGVLHLLGEDHATNDPSEPMLQKQEGLLIQLRG